MTRPGPQTPRGFTGLTAWEVVAQSFVCHPEWTAEMHAWYLVNEEPFPPGMVESLPIVAWLTDPADPAYIPAAVGRPS